MLLQVPGIAQAVVDTYEPAPGTTELVGYYSLRRDTAAVDHEAVYAQLRDRLPPTWCRPTSSTSPSSR